MSATVQLEPDEFRERIERLYVRAEGRDREAYRASSSRLPYEEWATRGAINWYAERAKTSAKNVSRWARGEHDVPGPALALLERLEREAGLEPLLEAAADARSYLGPHAEDGGQAAEIYDDLGDAIALCRGAR